MAKWTPSTVKVTVGTTSTLAVPRSTARKVLILHAAGSIQVYASWSDNAAANTGIPLIETGGAVVLTEAQHGALVHGPVYVASPAGATTWSYTECIGEPAEGY